MSYNVGVVECTGSMVECRGSIVGATNMIWKSISQKSTQNLLSYSRQGPDALVLLFPVYGS